MTPAQLHALKKVVINGNRYYQVSDDPKKLYPSVTSVLSAALPKPGLANWQRRFSLDAFKRKLITTSSIYHTPGTLIFQNYHGMNKR